MPLSRSQLVQRKLGISATDVSAIVGENPWRKPIDVWVEKLSDQDPIYDEPDERAALGHVFEAYIADHYKKTTAPQGMKRRLYAPRKTLVHPSLSWAMATPDRFVFDFQKDQPSPLPLAQLALDQKASHLLEIKLVGPRAIHHWMSDIDGYEDEDDVQMEERIPPYVYIQVQWQMFVTGYHLVEVAALLGGTTFRIFPVRRDQEFIRSLVQICSDFREKYLLTRTEPPADGSKSYEQFLKSRFAAPTIASLVEAPAMAQEAAIRYVELGQSITKMKAQRDSDKQLLQSLIGPHDGIQGSWGKATWKQSPGRVSYTQLVEALRIPEQEIEKYRTPSRTFRVALAKHRRGE